MVLRLKFVHSAHINMDIAVSLSPSGSLYDLQKRRYDFWEFRERAWPVDRENAKITLGIQANFVLYRDTFFFARHNFPNPKFDLTLIDTFFELGI